MAAALAPIIAAAGKAGVSNPVAASVAGSTIASLIPSLIQGLLGSGGALRSPTPPDRDWETQRIQGTCCQLSRD